MKNKHNPIGSDFDDFLKEEGLYKEIMSTLTRRRKMKRRFDVINYFIGKYNFTEYLEIGIDNPNNCFNKINCKNKTGVDPNKDTTFKMTSDDFFLQNTKTFDIIFIDGLHHKDQFVRDVENSLRVLNKNGIIVCHDCNPPTQNSAEHNRGDIRIWCGDVYLGWLKLRYSRTDLKMGVLPFDYGIGVIKKGSQEWFPILIEDYASFVATRFHSLPLITEKQLKEEF